MTDPLDAREVLALVARMSPPELALWRELGGDLTREQRRRVREWRERERKKSVFVLKNCGNQRESISHNGYNKRAG